jgi:hypothetical protein
MLARHQTDGHQGDLEIEYRLATLLDPDRQFLRSISVSAV